MIAARVGSATCFMINATGRMDATSAALSRSSCACCCLAAFAASRFSAAFVGGLGLAAGLGLADFFGADFGVLGALVFADLGAFPLLSTSAGSCDSSTASNSSSLHHQLPYRLPCLSPVRVDYLSMR
jgi:hypothetical protein